METEIGLSFANAAVSAISTEECLRNRHIARRAYDTAKGRMEGARLTDKQRSNLQAKLLKLTDTLKRAGDPDASEKDYRGLSVQVSPPQRGSL